MKVFELWGLKVLIDNSENLTETKCEMSEYLLNSWSNSDQAAIAASTNTLIGVHRRKIHQINKMSTDHQTRFCVHFIESIRGESTRRHNQDKFTLITKEINFGKFAEPHLARVDWFMCCLLIPKCGFYQKLLFGCLFSLCNYSLSFLLIFFFPSLLFCFS